MPVPVWATSMTRRAPGNVRTCSAVSKRFVEQIGRGEIEPTGRAVLTHATQLAHEGGTLALLHLRKKRLSAGHVVGVDETERASTDRFLRAEAHGPGEERAGIGEPPVVIQHCN